jgi:hypothetical protein
LDGQVFCFVYENENIARTAMDFCRERIGIGQPFAFLEPKVIPRSILKIDQPCLETTVPFITLEDGVIESLPNVICKLPSSPKEERFFHDVGVEVSFHSVELRGKGDIKKPSCGGYLCDRTQPYKVTHACDCFDISEKLSSIVLEYSLKVQLPGLGEGSINFEHYLRTTNLFVVSPQSLGILNADERFGEVKKLRKAVKKCCDYINKHGGFTINGTVTLGKVFDSSDNNVKVAAKHCTFHISYVMPSSLKMVADVSYTCLKYKYVANVETQGTVTNNNETPGSE